MIRLRRVLAALLLTVPAGAQVARLPTAEPALAAPVSVVPAFSGAALVSPAALTPSLAPAFVGAAPLSAPAAALSAPTAVDAAPAPSAAPAAAAAAPAVAASAASAPAADGRRRTPPTAAAPAAAPSDAGRILFDGSLEVRTRSGAVFVPSFTESSRNFPGGFAFVLSRPSPAARVKSIPRTQGLEGEALLARVSAIAAKDQRANIYRAASQYLFSTADNHSLGNVHGVTDAYAGVFIAGTSSDWRDYSESEDATHDDWPRAQTMNVEHVFPQSLFHGHVPMRSDLHHLMATLEHPNNVRGNLPFGVVKGTPDYRNDAGAKRGDGFFEPPDFTKGRVARAMLYFYARYHGEDFFKEAAGKFWNVQIATLLDWNRRFPPTVEERRRNDLVEQFQGNRNPFVDDPALADKIGLEAWRAPLPRARGGASAVSAAASSRRSEKPRSDEPRSSKPRQSFHRPQRSSFRR